MGDLTKNFSLYEVVCRCCGKYQNTPQFWEGIFKLQELRDLIGQPLIITSGYRCPSYNKAVRGAPQSNHLAGHAFDVIIPPNVSISQFIHLAKKVGFKGIGSYPKQNFVHLDLGPERYW